jgi:hypothetical protein
VVLFSAVVLSIGCSPSAEPPPSPLEETHISEEVFGHRFTVTADVDGNGVLDTLTEEYYSGRLARECAKYIKDMEYDSLVKRTYDLEPLVRLRSSDGQIDTLSDRAGGFGLALLLNEGDLDGDGADEIGYVLDNADWSNTNTYFVISHKDSGWEPLFSFEIWDRQLPDLPDIERNFGLIGQTGRRIHEPVDTLPSVDLVISVRPGVAMVVGNIGDATLDTMEVLFPQSVPNR